jgi:hypothetical protein
MLQLQITMKARATICILALMLLTDCQFRAPKAPEVSSGWAGDMQQMGESLATLLPITMDPVQFNDPANQDLIDRQIARLSHFAHDVSQTSHRPSEDPSFEFVSGQFASEMNEAKHQLQIGNRTYARFLIRGASNYCVSCHTQTDRGPHFLAAPSSPYFSKLTPLDKANYLIAVWNFDAGLQEYDKAMNSPDVALQPYSSLESATLRALAVAVRVKKDPLLAEAIVTRIMYSKWAPVYLQLTAEKWKASLREWKVSRKPARTLDDAKQLISRAWSKQMESPLARAGLIESLRASGLLHELLAQKKPGKAYAEALYFAGLNAEALKDLDPFLLNEAYFEACVKHLPHSDIAKDCYLRLEGEQIADYGPFENTPMPQKVRNKLTDLRKLAEPVEGSWLDWDHGDAH